MAERFVRLPLALLKRADLSAPSMIVLAAIGSLVGLRKRETFPAPEIASFIDWPLRNVQRALENLVKAGDVIAEPSPSDKRATQYRLATAPPAKSAPDPAQTFAPDPARTSGESAPDPAPRFAPDVSSVRAGSGANPATHSLLPEVKIPPGGDTRAPAREATPPPLAPKGPGLAKAEPSTSDGPPSAKPTPVRVVDSESAQRRLKQLVEEAWLKLRARPLPPAEHQPLREAARWLWQVVNADCQAFEERASAMVQAWASEDYVHKLQKGAGFNFRSNVERLFDGGSVRRAAPTSSVSAPASFAPPPRITKSSGPRTFEDFMAIGEARRRGRKPHA